jgi:large subunit ribosomal protein L6
MSRIGKLPVLIPDKVKVAVAGRRIQVEGPKGKLEFELPIAISAKVEASSVSIIRENEERQSKALHGLTRSLVNNMVIGTTKGFQKRLEITGVGFKAALAGKKLNLSLGKSHPIVYPVPDDIKVTVEENTKILIEGVDKQKVGAVAADIRGYYPPEPYKGKGVKYAGEIIRRKEGKTAQSK